MSRRASQPFILATVFIDVIGIGLMLPVLPTLIGSLTTSPTAQSWWYGALMLTYGLVQFLCVPLLGALSDRFGRRPILLLSIFGLGVSYLVTAVTDSLWLLLLTRVLIGATGASFTVACAYMADITPPEQRGKGFGAIGAAFGIGFIVGPVIGGLLGEQDVRLPFWVAAGLSLLNGLYGYFLLPESLAPANRSRFAWQRANPLGALKHLTTLPNGANQVVLIYAISMLSQWVLQTGWVLYTSFRFGWGPKESGIALFVVGITAATMQGVLLGPLIKRFGEKRMALAGMLSSAIFFTGYGLADTPALLYACILGNLLTFAISPSLQSLISRATPASDQGITQGAVNGLNSLMTLLAPLISTPLLTLAAHLPAGDWRMGAMFFACAGLQVLALTLAARHFRRQAAARLQAATSE